MQPDLYEYDISMNIVVYSDLDIHCKENSCRKISVECPVSENSDCTVDCDGEESCWYAEKVRCSETGVCGISCIGDEACFMNAADPNFIWSSDSTKNCLYCGDNACNEWTVLPEDGSW